MRTLHQMFDPFGKFVIQQTGSVRMSSQLYTT